MQDGVDGSRDRLPTMNEVVRMTYLDATVHEVWRYNTIVPLGVTRQTLCDTKVDGLFIPKGTMVGLGLLLLTC